MDSTIALEWIRSLGVPVCVAAYYMYKDWKQSERMLELVGRVEQLLEQVQPILLETRGEKAQ